MSDIEVSPEAEALHQHRADPGEWSEESEDIKVRARRSEVVSFRLPSEEVDHLEESAAALGESLSEFIRKAVTLRLSGAALATPWVEFTTGRANLVLAVREWIDATSQVAAEHAVEVPDYPPESVNTTG